MNTDVWYFVIAFLFIAWGMYLFAKNKLLRGLLCCMIGVCSALFVIVGTIIEHLT